MSERVAVTENHETRLDIRYTLDELDGQVETVQLPNLNEHPHLFATGAGWIQPLIDGLRVGWQRAVAAVG